MPCLHAYFKKSFASDFTTVSNYHTEDLLMKQFLRYATIVFCFFAISGIAVSAADKKKQAPKAADTLSGVYEGINTDYDNYVMATYNFSKNTVKIATEKEDIDCVWKIEGSSLAIYYLVNGKPSSEVYETWVWNAEKKIYTMKEADGLILKKKGK